MYVFYDYLVVLCTHNPTDSGCQFNNGGCEHLCEKGGKCSCLTGYQLVDDGKHCQGKYISVLHSLSGVMV